jgi:hypothetical protein
MKLPMQLQHKAMTRKQRRWTSPAMHSLCVTSDGFVISGDNFIGAKSDLVNNWNSLLTAAGLAMDEKIAADSLFTQQVMQF